MTATDVGATADIDAVARAMAPPGLWDGDWIFPSEREEYRDNLRARARAALAGEDLTLPPPPVAAPPLPGGSTPDGPHDFAAEREDARRATWWRYSRPGQWIDGHWETYERGAA